MPLRGHETNTEAYICVCPVNGQEGAKMKLYELCRDLYMECDQNNFPTRLHVISDHVAEKYGHVYEGERVRFGGIGGRIGNIPAYLGGEEVLGYTVDILQSGEYSVTINI